jgi:hypothetical protein
MKKLLPIILLLSFSTTLFAREVTLLCVAGNNKMKITVDAETGLLDGKQLERRGEEWVGRDFSHIKDAEIYMIERRGDGYISHLINRIDGSYTRDDRGGTARIERGTCSPAKLAF